MLLPKIWIICRVCLRQQDELFNLFDDTVHKNIWSFLRDCSGLPVRKNDSFPDKICEACLRRLWKAMNFRMDCQRSHRELLQKQMESNAFMYEEENSFELFKTSNQPTPENNTEEPQISACPNKVEEDNSFEHFKTSNQPTPENIREEPQISACPNKDEEENSFEHFKTSNPPNPENITEEPQISACPNKDKEETLPEPVNGDENIKQYCIVTRSAKKERSAGYENESQSKQPIVLLLRLKNLSNESSKNETGPLEKLETETTPISKKKTRGRPKKVVDVKKGRTNLTNKKAKIQSNNDKDIKLKRKLQNVKRKFACKICKKIYKTNELLRHHMYTHRRPYECNICHKKFSQGQSFLSHNNKHSGIKPYYCRICFATFADISNRNNHERQRHKEKKFKCNACDKSFRFLTLLQRHSQSHKPKKCFICNMDFASVRMVRIHHQRRHLKLLNVLQK